MPATPRRSVAYLDALGIETDDRRASRRLHGRGVAAGARRRSPAAHSKNLFVKDKKGRFFLITAEDETRRST